ncbi:phosphoglycolate phosphatase [Aliikangiella coralliicola]|uniref:phosphoglycolate phosphatase n=1 Tax=Aliikangiella coralliicola TaxID=2592383 RepID=A0A545U4W5_9GAMM|nr:phosphoglycolate phosphatase [Aliikangiella coralliicola]TQV84516.1 phosphoglycolate phosphatase [Aliikangiella coralliicola]
MIAAVFFDLDGTLVDTARDLGNAINRVLTEHGKAPLPQEIIRPYVSGGSPALIKLGFDITSEHNDFEQLKQSFLDYYAQALDSHSHLFPGIQNCLTELEKHNIPWGIVTNKPDFLTQPLLAKLELKTRASVIISGDTFQQKKPDPYPLIQACLRAEVPPEKSIYVGDDERDIIAANAANMISMSVGWGYPGDKDPQQWRSDYYVAKSEELISMLKTFIE